MNRTPLAPIEFLGVGDILSGQDGNKYVVCKKGNILYWEPYTVASPSKPIRKVKEAKEKYYWKDNDKKPWYDGGKWNEMTEALKPKVSPNKFPAGYVWTTKFSNISFIVDIEYKGYSTTHSKVWMCVSKCPPCIDANDYPFQHISNDCYYVEYDKQGNKFWCFTYTIGDMPIQQANKFVEGTAITTIKDGTTYISRRGSDCAYWDDK